MNKKTRRGIALWNWPRGKRYNRVFLRKSERQSISKVMGVLIRKDAMKQKGIPITVLSEQANITRYRTTHAVWLLNARKFCNIFQPDNKRYRYIQLTKRGKQWHTIMKKKQQEKQQAGI